MDEFDTVTVWQKRALAVKDEVPSPAPQPTIMHDCHWMRSVLKDRDFSLELMDSLIGRNHFALIKKWNRAR